jgi:cyanate permease
MATVFLDGAQMADRTSMGGEFRQSWQVLAGAALGASLGAASLPFYTAGVFVRPLEVEFGWSREQLAVAATAATFLGAATAPLVGALVDRFGVRRPAALSMAALGLSFVALSQLQGGFGQYLATLMALTLFAAASTPVSFTRAVNAWFDRAKGLALGMTVGGIGVVAAVAPRATDAVLEAQGWRGAYLALAATVAVAIPAVWFLLGARGDREPQSALATPQIRAVEVFRMPSFWRLAAAFSLLSAGIAGFVLHLIPMLVDAGVSPRDAAGVQGLLGLSVLGGRLITGAIIDHVFAPRVAAGLILTSACGVGALAIGGPAVAPMAAVALGFALGAEVDLIGYLTARYFGLRAYGRVYGLLYGAFVVGAGVSPMLIAVVAAQRGYPTALTISVGLMLAVAGLFATAPAFPGREGARS